jgi:hypothetical protein
VAAFETLADELMEPVGPLRLDRYAGISGLFQEFRDEGFTWSRIARAPLLRSAYGAPMGAFSTDLRAAVRREVLGLGSQERYPREYSESIWFLEGLLDSGVQGTRRRPS